MFEMQRRPCTYHRRGVNAHIPEISGRGYLLGFGVDYEEFESGPGNFTVAIVEDADTGQLLSLMPTCVKMECVKMEYVSRSRQKTRKALTCSDIREDGEEGGHSK